MRNRPRTLRVVVVAVGVLCAGRAWANDYTTAGNVNGALVQPTLNAGGSGGDLIFAGNHTITISAADLTQVNNITVNAGAAAVIDFNATVRKLVFRAGSHAISIGAGGSLTILVGAAGAGLDFATNNSNAVLTIDGPIAGGAVAGNKLFLGNNTLRTQTNTVTLNDVSIGGANATIDADSNTTITTLTNSAALAFDIAAATRVTLTNPTLSGGAVSLVGAASTSVLELDGASTGIALTATGSATLDIDANTTFASLDSSGSTLLGFDIATGTTVIITSPTLTGTSTTLTGAAGSSVLRLSGASTGIALTTTGSATLDIDANTTFASLDSSGSTLLALDIPSGVTVIITSPNLSGTSTTLTGAAASSVLRLAGASTGIALTLTGSATFDIDANTTFASLDGSGSTLLAFDIAAGTTATVTSQTFSGTATTLTGAGATSVLVIDGGAAAIASLTISGTSTLDVNAALTVTAFTLSAAASIDVAGSTTLTATNGVQVGTNTLTLSGPGTITRIDATTGTVTNDGGTDIGDLRVTPGAAGTFTHGGTGTATITALTPTWPASNGTVRFTGSGDVTVSNAVTPGNTDNLMKTGTGTLRLDGGFAFTNTAVDLDLDVGTVVVGTQGSNDAVTFTDANDTIDVAAGATITTYGSFTGAGGSPNFAAAVGSVVNLASADADETFVSTSDNNFNLLGTVNLTNNGTYTINDTVAREYNFGSININGSAKFINNLPDSRMHFVSGARVFVASGATLTIDGQAAGTTIELDTVDGTGQFSLHRNGTPVVDFALGYVQLIRTVYTSNTGCTAQWDGVDVANLGVDGTSYSWLGGCPGTGGGASPSPEEDPATAIANADGTAHVSTDAMGAWVAGVPEGTRVQLATSAEGVTALVIGEASHPILSVLADGFEDGSDLDVVVTDTGGQVLILTDAAGAEVLALEMNGLEDQPAIDVSLDPAGDPTVVLDDARDRAITLQLTSLPIGSGVSVERGDSGTATVVVSDRTGDALGVAIEASGADAAVVFSIVYNPVPNAARIVAGFPGFENGETLGGSITIAASGLTDDALLALSLLYPKSDLVGIDESSLRVGRLREDTSVYEPAGTNDVGVGVPTGIFGDHGIDLAENAAWAELDELGTFAVGVPALVPEVLFNIQPGPDDDTASGDDVQTDETISGPVIPGFPCGPVGLASWLMTVGGVGFLRTRRCNE